MNKLTEYWPFENFYTTKLNITEEEINQIKIFLYNFKNYSRDPHQTTTHQCLNILDLPILVNLKKQITDLLNTLNLDLDNSWAQLYKKGDSHGVHHHGSSIYSGVLYVDGRGKDGTSFINPIPVSKDVVKQAIFEKNTLILFPSSILHYVENQKEDNERIIISFNTKQIEPNNASQKD